jgi:hypothetical protein
MVGLTHIIGKIHKDSRGWFVQYREKVKLLPSEILVCNLPEYNYSEGETVTFEIIESWADLSLVPFAKIIK